MFWIVRRTAAGIETLAAAISSLLVLVLALVLAFLLLLLLAAAAAAARACFCSARLSRTGGWTEANPERGAGRREEGRKEGEGGGKEERKRRERKRRWGERERERDLWEGFVGGREGREGRNACVARWLWGLTLHYTTGVYKNGGGATDGRIFFVFQTFFYSFIYI